MQSGGGGELAAEGARACLTACWFGVRGQGVEIVSTGRPVVAACIARCLSMCIARRIRGQLKQLQQLEEAICATHELA